MYNFNEIREHYEYLTPFIFEAAKDHPKRWASPYGDIDWPTTFSPIEMDTWQVIRSFGKVPMYPQYPVIGYFLDFGNPVLKIGIECDGKEWHTDKEKDARRDEKLLKHGWRIFRVTGSECVKVTPAYYERDEIYDEDEYEVVQRQFYETMEGLVKALSYFYFDYKEYYKFESEIRYAHKCLVRCASPTQQEVIEQELSDIYIRLVDEYYEYFEKNNIPIPH